MKKKILKMIFYFFVFLFIFIFKIHLDIYTEIKIFNMKMEGLSSTSEDDIKEMRKYLNKKHIEYCEKRKLHYFKNDSDIILNIKKGILRKLVNSPYWSIDSSVCYPYLLSDAYGTFCNIMLDFQRYFLKNQIISFKPIITSALRTDSFQIELRKRNKNAAIKSSHCFGVSIDVWYDGFDICLQNFQKIYYSKFKKFFPEIDNEKIKKVLVEILKNYQEQGLIYLIYEKEQHCFHITFLD
uniref:Uncharacterized protein n=1 Tax=candidate division WOR-3 bacterium TaxID=2052148 RepID=A0A7C4YSQ2_UNCW3